MFGLFFGFLLGAFSTFVYKNLYGDESKTRALTDGGLFSKGLAGSAMAAASNVERSGSFLTDLIGSIWTQVNEAVCTEIKNTVEPMFKTMLPGPLKTLHFTKLDLGTVPLRLDNCIVHECKTNVNGTKYVAMEVDVVWDGLCDIELKADYVGKLGISHLKLAGRMSIIMQPLVSVIPVVGAVQYAFVNPPILELDFTGLANVADISSIKNTIDKTIQDILAGMLVVPNRMMTKLDEVQGPFFQAYQPPLGVARISVVKGRGFIPEKRSLRKADIPDVYCRVKLGATELWTTDVVKNSLNPVFGKNESADGLLFDYDQVLTIEAFDKDDGTMDTDDPLGSAQLNVGDILLSGKTKEVELLNEGRGSGAYILLHCDLLKLEPQKRCEVAAKSTTENPKLLAGLLTVLISQAYKIPPKPEDDSPPVNYFVKVTYGEKVFFSAVVDGAYPVFDTAFRIPVTAPEDIEPKIKCALFCGAAAEDNETNVLIGEFEVDSKSVVDSPKCTVSGQKAVVNDGPEVGYQIMFRATDETCVTAPDLAAVASGASAASSSLPTSNSGDTMVEVSLHKGWGFQVEKRKMKRADIPDVYCNIQFGSSPTVWRTATIKNNLSPAWGESKTFRMLDHGQIIAISALDEDGGGRDEDDVLGSARISVGKVLLAGGTFDVELQDEGKPSGCYVSIECKVVSEPSAPPPPLPPVTNSTVELVAIPGASASTNSTLGEPKTESASEATKASVAEPMPVAAANAEPPAKVIKCVHVTAVSGTGFEIEKRKFAKDDIPDVYCKISVGSRGKPWQTCTVKNSLAPAWNESKDFAIESQDDIVCIEAYDEDKGISKDDLLGKTKVSVRKLLESGGDVLLQLDMDGKPSDCFVTVRCSAA